MKFKIKSSYERLNPKIKDSDYDNLKNNIGMNGIKNPISILPDGTIICGHNRYKIWVNDLKRKEEEIPYIIETFGEDRDKDIKIYKRINTFFV